MVKPPSKGSLLVIFLTVFVDLLGFGIVLPLLPIYANLFAIEESGWELGLLMASFSAMQFLFAPVWGQASDRFGRRPILMLGLCGSVVCYTLFGLATSYRSLTWLFVSRIGAGVFGATIPTAQAYIADCTTAETRARGMALIGMAFGLGFTIGPLVGCLAVGSEDQPPGPWPGYVAAGLSGAALLLAAVSLPESLPAEVRAERRGPGPRTRPRWRQFRRALTIPSIPPLLATIFVSVMAFAQFETMLPLVISERSKVVTNFGFSERQVFLTFAFIGLILAIVQGGVVRRVVGRVSETWLASSGILIEVAGFGLMGWAVGRESVTWLFVALAVTVSGFAFMPPSLNGLLSRRTPPDQQGGILGVGQSANALGRIVGSAIGIPLLYQNLYWPLWGAAFLMVVCLGLILIQSASGRDYGASPTAH